MRLSTNSFMSSKAAFFLLAMMSYALAFLCLWLATLLARFGYPYFYGACLAWLLVIFAVGLWHFRRLVWLSPQMLLAGNIVQLFYVQQSCYIGLRPCYFL